MSRGSDPPAPLPAHGNRPNPTAAIDPELRWARDPHDGRLHALASCDVRRAESRGYAECLCTHQLPAEVVFEGGPSGPSCLPCVIGAVPDLRALGLLDGPAVDLAGKALPWPSAGGYAGPALGPRPARRSATE